MVLLGDARHRQHLGTCFTAVAARILLGLPYVPVIFDDEFEHLFLLVGFFKREQDPPVALGDLTFHDCALGIERQIEQASRICDGRFIAAHSLTNPLIGQIKLVDQFTIGSGEFDRVELRALDILNKCQLKFFLLIKTANNDGNRIKSSEFCRPKPSLTSDQLIPIAVFGDNEWLEDAVYADACCQCLKGCLIEDLAWLVRVGINHIGRQLVNRVGRGALARLIYLGRYIKLCLNDRSRDE